MISQASALLMLTACDEARVALNRMLEVECGLRGKSKNGHEPNTPYSRTLKEQIASLTAATTAARKDMAAS